MRRERAVGADEAKRVLQRRQRTGCGDVAYGHSGGGAGFKTDVWVAGNGERDAVLLLNRRGDGAADERAGAAMRRLHYAAPAEAPR